MILVRRASAFLNRIRRHLMVWLSSFIIFLILLSGELKSWIGFAKKSIRTRSYDSVSFCSLVAVGILSVLFLSLSFFLSPFISFSLFLLSGKKKGSNSIFIISFSETTTAETKQQPNVQEKRKRIKCNPLFIILEKTKQIIEFTSRVDSFQISDISRSCLFWSSLLETVRFEWIQRGLERNIFFSGWNYNWLNFRFVMNTFPIIPVSVCFRFDLNTPLSSLPPCLHP